MSRTSNPAFTSKLAAIALIAAACALTGCGRKAGLDLPPGANAAQAVPTPQSNPDSQYTTAGAATAQGNVFDSSRGANAQSVAPKGPNKRIFLDSLLD